jgi:hypothetical protein
MAEVFAGFIVGYAVALFIAPLGAILLVRSNDHTGFAQRVAPPGTNIVALSVVIHFAAVIVFTALGLVLGMALAGLNDRHPADGLGSPNSVYTAMVLALTVIVVAPAFLFPAVRRVAVVAAVVFALSFGWGVPWLATLRA